MDWFSWLSTANLNPSLIHDYSLSFTQNELEREDIAYFDHEFLQSMGISVAKHRLEILKLVRRDLKHSHHRSISRFATAIKKTGKCLRAWIRRKETSSSSSSSRALVLVPKRNSGKWRGGFMKRNKRSVMPSNGDKQERLLLTDGRIDSFSSPMVFDYSFSEDKHEDNDAYLGNDVEEIKWDSMFQNLKPT